MPKCCKQCRVILDWVIRAQTVLQSQWLSKYNDIQVATHQSKAELRDQSRYAPSQWETALHCNDVSHWLGAYLDWSLRTDSHDHRSTYKTGTWYMLRHRELAMPNSITLIDYHWFNLLSPETCGDFKREISLTSDEITFRWMPQNISDDKSTLAHVMAWCCQATSQAITQYLYSMKLYLWPPSAAYHMNQWIGSALAQIMACHLFSAKPLSKPMLRYC